MFPLCPHMDSKILSFHHPGSFLRRKEGKQHFKYRDVARTQYRHNNFIQSIGSLLKIVFCSFPNTGECENAK